MLISYASTRQEVWRFYWRSLRTNRLHLGSWLLLVGSMGAATFEIAHTGLALSGEGAASVAILAMLASAAWLALYPQIKFKPQQRTLEVTALGISTSIAGQAKSWPWSDVRSVSREGDSIVITSRTLNAMLVPARAFASPTEADNFFVACDQWCRASQAARDA